MRIFSAILAVSCVFVPVRVMAQAASSVTSVFAPGAPVVAVPPPSTEVVRQPIVTVPATVPTAAAAEVPATVPQIVPQLPAPEIKKEKPAVSEAPKGEYVQWRRGYVSGVSDNIITVVVATKQRAKSYEPVMITPGTKLMRGNKPARLADIKIRQYISVRGYRYGDIVRADEFVIGGRLSSDPIARPVAKKKTSKTKVKRPATPAKKKPVKAKRS